MIKEVNMGIDSLAKKTELLAQTNEQFSSLLLDYWNKKEEGVPADISNKEYLIEPLATDIEIKNLYDKISDLNNEIYNDDLEKLLTTLFSFRYGLPEVEDDYSDAGFVSTFNKGFIENIKVAIKNLSESFVDNDDKIGAKNTLTIAEVVDIQNSLFLFERNGNIEYDENIFRYKDIPFEKTKDSFCTRKEVKLCFDRNPKSMVVDFEELQSLKDFVINNYNSLLASYEDGDNRVKVDNNGSDFYLYFEKGDGGRMSIYLNTGATRIYFV